MSAAKKLKPIELIDPLAQEIAACVESVFKEAFGIAVQLKECNIGKELVALADVSGVVGMVQKDLEGDLILSFSQPVIFDILRRVYNKDFDTIDEAVTQGAAEMANMIHGHLKVKMNDRGHDLQMVLPTNLADLSGQPHCNRLLITFEYDREKEFKVFVALRDH